MRVTAIIAAGSRPEADALAVAAGVPVKALVPVGGVAMLARVARTLVDHPSVTRVIILAQDHATLTAHPDLEWIAERRAVSFESSDTSLSAGLAKVLERHPDDYPFLVTTADHPLLDHAMIDVFLAGAGTADVAFAVVERATLLSAYPDNRRTWLKFGRRAYSGANLFLLRTPRALAALRLWRGIEQQRKRARAVIGAFGPAIMLGVALRLLSLRRALSLAGRRLGLTAAAVDLPMAEACIDVDKPGDLALVEAILARRASGDL